LTAFLQIHIPERVLLTHGIGGGSRRGEDIQLPLLKAELRCDICTSIALVNREKLVGKREMHRVCAFLILNVSLTLDITDSR
jgi:hypothetical protein